MSNSDNQIFCDYPTNSQYGFLLLISDLMGLDDDHPFRKGVIGIPEIGNIDFPERENLYDVYSNTRCYTSHDNDIIYRDKAIYEMFRKSNFVLPGVDPEEAAVATLLEQFDHAETCNLRLREILYTKDESLTSNINFQAFIRIMNFSRTFCHILLEHAKVILSTEGIMPRLTDGAVQTSGKDLKKGNSPIERFSHAALSEDVAYIGKNLGDMFYKQCRGHATKPFWSSFMDRARVVGKPDKVNFVPKTYKTHRTTTKGIVGDVAIQCGIGDILSHSLKLSGYDISDLPTLHQELARQGSISGLTATFDMKGGSQNVFSELAKFMLDPLIYDVLIASRNSTVDINGNIKTLPIMATEGNGFCFPLETVIFLSLQMGVAASRGLKPKIGRVKTNGISHRYIRKGSYHNLVSTYGDDVIIPTFISSTFMETFKILGIRLNLDKSHYLRSDRFRESCGGHYHNGRDVNCFNSKTVPTLENTDEVKKYLNGIRAFGYSNNCGRWRHPDLRSLWHGIIHYTSGLTFNQGINGDTGVLVPRTYSVTRYVRPSEFTLLSCNLQGQILGSTDSRARIVTKIHRRETLRFSKSRYSNKLCGHPIVSQAFIETRYSEKITLPAHLRKNSIPPLPLSQIAGQGLISGAGLQSQTSLLFEETDSVTDRSGVAQKVFKPYPDYFIVDRLKKQSYIVYRDPYSIDNESIDELFSRIRPSFERTRIGRITRQTYARRRSAIWDSRRGEVLSKVMSLLKHDLQRRKDDVRKLFE